MVPARKVSLDNSQAATVVGVLVAAVVDSLRQVAAKTVAQDYSYQLSLVARSPLGLALVVAVARLLVVRRAQLAQGWAVRVRLVAQRPPTQALAVAVPRRLVRLAEIVVQVSSTSGLRYNDGTLRASTERCRWQCHRRQ